MNSFQGDRRKSRSISRWYSSPWLIIPLLLIGISLARGSYENYQKSVLTERDLATAKKELVGLEERKAFIENKLTRLRTASGLDEELKKNFPVAAIGEKVVVVVDKSELPTTTGASSTRGFSVKKLLGF